jgi:UPF0755 protein
MMAQPPSSRGVPPPSASARRRRRVPAIVLVAVFVGGGILALGVAAWWVTIAVERPYKGWAGDEVFVEIPQGAGVIGVARRLADAGVIEDPRIFRLAVWQRGAERALKAGEYRFSHPMSPRRVVDMLARGDVYLQPITFPEGLAIDEMAAIFAQQGFGGADEFIEAAANPSLIADLDHAASDLEGYLFPDTYQLPRRAPASDLVKTMVARFRSIATEEAVSRASARGLSVRQWVTLASLVEKETGKDEERPLVAAVYANRTRIGMGLQCDPTVIYALKRAGRWDGNLTRENLQIDSPYNTYRYAGLPPGPIASAGRASLEAALAPADVDYLYFVSRNDGSHVFARTLAEHNQNVRRFQVEFYRQRRLKKLEG